MRLVAGVRLKKAVMQQAQCYLLAFAIKEWLGNQALICCHLPSAICEQQQSALTLAQGMCTWLELSSGPLGFVQLHRVSMKLKSTSSALNETGT